MRTAIETRSETSLSGWARADETRQAKSTVAISAATLVCWGIVVLTLLSGSWYRQESVGAEHIDLELRKSLIPGEFSCPHENCAKRAATDASSILHMTAKPV
jgi:hypothetical protein